MERKTRTHVSENQINAMCSYIKQGKSIDYVAEVMGINSSTVHRNTKKIIGKTTYKRVPKAILVEELKKGIEVKEISDKLGVKLERVERIYREKLSEMPKKVVPLSKRQEEVKKIGEEVRRQEMKRLKEYELQLDEEKRMLELRFKGIVK